VICEAGGTDVPVHCWEYAGSSYRLSVVGGLTRFEQEVRGGWYLIEPGHDTTAMMVCAEQLAQRLQEVESTVVHLRRVAVEPC
jgi:hypothetical protein